MDAPKPTDVFYVTITRAQRELGGCSRSYVYSLIDRKLIRSINPGGRRRLVELQSIRALLRKGEAKRAEAA